MSKLTHKAVGDAEVKVLDSAQGIVEAYVNTMDVIDEDGEIIQGGAFDASIAARLPSVAWFHDWRTIVGKVTSARQDGNRLAATMQFNLDTQRGREAFSDVAGGYVREWSVGFYNRADRMDQIDGRKVRVIEQVDWVEVSPVLRGASPNTATAAAKSQEPAADEPPAAATSDDAAATEQARAAVALTRQRLRLAGISTT